MEASALRAPVGPIQLPLSGALLKLRSDEQLVSAFRGGNDAAFEVIHDRYRQRLVAYARNLLRGSTQDAEDAVQDVFVRAYGALRVDERPMALRAWLYRIAHNRCLDELRRPAPTPSEAVEGDQSGSGSPVDEADVREDLRRLVVDIKRLPVQQRSILLMRELGGASYQDLAIAHDLTLPAVRASLVRARLNLTEAAEARDAACEEIRCDLALAAGRASVRVNARARRHLHDCAGCREYRESLNGLQRNLAALAPGGGAVGLLAKCGLGWLAGGAAAGGGGAAGGGAAAAGGSAVLGLSVAKVAAIVVSVAAVAGGAAVGIHHKLSADSHSHHRTAAKASPAAHGRAGAGPLSGANEGFGGATTDTAGEDATKSDQTATDATDQQSAADQTQTSGTAATSDSATGATTTSTGSGGWSKPSGSGSAPSQSSAAGSAAPPSGGWSSTSSSSGTSGSSDSSTTQTP